MHPIYHEIGWLPGKWLGEEFCVDGYRIGAHQMAEAGDLAAARRPVAGSYHADRTFAGDPKVVECSDARIKPKSKPFLSEQPVFPLDGPPVMRDEEKIGDFPLLEMAPVPQPGGFGVSDGRDEVRDVEVVQVGPNMSIVALPVSEERRPVRLREFGILRRVVQKLVSMIGKISKRAAGWVVRLDVREHSASMSGAVSTDRAQAFIACGAARAVVVFPRALAIFLPKIGGKDEDVAVRVICLFHSARTEVDLGKFRTARTGNIPGMGR